MRKLILALFIASIAAAGFAGTASASTASYNPSASSYCNFNPADPQCHQTPPGAPGFCGPTSFGFHGTCTPDTLSFTSKTRGHDGNWNTDRNRGPHDPCIIKFPVRHAQDSSWSQYQRGCRCETVKIWHTKIIWIHGCKKEIRYYTTEVTCKHQRDPRPCTCQHGGLQQPAITRHVA